MQQFEGGSLVYIQVLEEQNIQHTVVVIGENRMQQPVYVLPGQAGSWADAAWADAAWADASRGGASKGGAAFCFLFGLISLRTPPGRTPPGEVPGKDPANLEDHGSMVLADGIA